MGVGPAEGEAVVVVVPEAHSGSGSFRKHCPPSSAGCVVCCCLRALVLIRGMGAVVWLSVGCGGVRFNRPVVVVDVALVFAVGWWLRTVRLLRGWLVLRTNGNLTNGVTQQAGSRKGRKGESSDGHPANNATSFLYIYVLTPSCAHFISPPFFCLSPDQNRTN